MNVPSVCWACAAGTVPADVEKTLYMAADLLMTTMLCCSLAMHTHPCLDVHRVHQQWLCSCMHDITNEQPEADAAAAERFNRQEHMPILVAQSLAAKLRHFELLVPPLKPCLQMLAMCSVLDEAYRMQLI